VFENRVLRRIFGPKRDEVTGEWRKLHNEELRDLYSSPSIIRIIKSRRMRWAGHVARMAARCLLVRLILHSEDGGSSKTPVHTRTTPHYIPEMETYINTAVRTVFSLN
jgi:hypothetical protein